MAKKLVKSSSKARKSSPLETEPTKIVRSVGRPRKTEMIIPKLSQAGKEKQTRIEIMQTIAGNTGLSKNQVQKVFSAVAQLLQNHMKKKGSGEFTIPMTGVKVRRVKKKATKARTMVSPLTGQEVQVPAKPSRAVIKIKALKPLKKVIIE